MLAQTIEEPGGIACSFQPIVAHRSDRNSLSIIVLSLKFQRDFARHIRAVRHVLCYNRSCADNHIAPDSQPGSITVPAPTKELSPMCTKPHKTAPTEMCNPLPSRHLVYVSICY